MPFTPTLNPNSKGTMENEIIEKHWLVKTGSQTEAQIIALMVAREAVMDQWIAFAKAQGAETPTSRDDRCDGIADGAPDPGVWKQASKRENHVLFTPNLKTKAGREARKQLKALPTRPSTSTEVTKIITGGEGRSLSVFGVHEGLLVISSPGLGWANGRYIITTPTGGDSVPRTFTDDLESIAPLDFEQFVLDAKKEQAGGIVIPPPHAKVVTDQSGVNK